MSDYQKLYRSNQESFIAYRKNISKSNKKIGLVFLSGFNSNMSGTKAEAFSRFSEQNDFDFIRFDYSGHGSSSGNFVEGSINSWLEDVLYVLDELTHKPQILIGSSMGGWLMLLAALARPSKVVSLIGLAAAPDFTENLIWKELSIEQKVELKQKGLINYKNEFCEDEYPISQKLILESRKHLLLNNDISINIPIHLIHGMEDKDVPFETSIELAKKVTSKFVEISLIKNSGHRLSEISDLNLVYKIIQNMYEKLV